MTPVASQVAVYRRATGALEHLAPATLAPSASDPTFASVALPAGFDNSAFVWSATAKAMVEDPAKVQAMLLASVKAEAERRKMLALSSGGAKKTEYADKAAEVRTWHTLGGTLTGVVAVLGVVSGAKMQATFPYAIADAAAFGDTVDKAIARFIAGMAASASVPSISAAEAKACAAIKAGTTAAMKRTAAAAVTWP